MDAVDEFFNFRERCQHALVNLDPYFAVMFIEMRIVSTSGHIVYRGNDLYAQDFLLADVNATSSFNVLLRDRNDRHRHGILADVPH